MALKKFSLAVAAIAVGSTGFLAVGSASAAPIITDGQTTNLVVHKYIGDAWAGAANNGTVQTAPTGAIKGQDIAFELYQVEGVDLTTNAGWEAAAALYNCDVTGFTGGATITCAGNTYNVTHVETKATGADGTVTFATQPVGLYLVRENLADPLTTNGNKDLLTASAPFLVTLPMTDPNGPDGDPLTTADNNTTWMSTVNVYPKNKLTPKPDTIVKAVLDGNVGTANQDAHVVGQNLTYTLTSSINVLESDNQAGLTGGDLGYYYIGDNLSDYVIPGVDAANATIAPVVSVGGTTLTGCALGVAPTAGCDYQWSFDAKAAGGLKIVFTKAGLDVLAQHNGGTVLTTFVVKVNSMPADGIVPNTGSFIPSNGWWTSQPGNPAPLTPGEPDGPSGTTPTGDNPGVPSNTVESKYGDIVIKKTAENGTDLLTGATFAVYRAGADNACTDADAVGTPVATTTAATANGYAKAEGLQLSNWYNGGTQTTLHSYCLVETQSPKGYQLLADPIKFDVLVEGQAPTDLSTALAGQIVSVKNLKDNINNQLPLTGGAGIAALSLGGLALMGGGLGYYLVASKRRRASETAAR